MDIMPGGDNSRQSTNATGDHSAAYDGGGRAGRVDGLKLTGTHITVIVVAALALAAVFALVLGRSGGHSNTTSTASSGTSAHDLAVQACRDQAQAGVVWSRDKASGNDAMADGDATLYRNRATHEAQEAAAKDTAYSNLATDIATDNDSSAQLSYDNATGNTSAALSASSGLVAGVKAEQADCQALGVPSG